MAERKLGGIYIQPVPLFSEMYARGYADVAQFARDFLDWEAHPGQAKWLGTRPDADERMLSAANRWGKTEVGAVKELHDCFYQYRDAKYAHLIKKYRALNLSITMDQARIGWDKALRFALNRPRFKRFLLDIDKQPPAPTLYIGTSRHARDGVVSRLEARSTVRKGTYILGHHFDLISWDEPARDPSGAVILDDVVRMRLADRAGRLDFTSTGNLRNWYYIQHQLGVDDETGQYYSQTGSAYENPHIDHAKVRRSEKRMTDAMRQQNVYGLFADYATIFDPSLVQACYKDQDYSYPVAPVSGGVYAGGIDLARKRDETVVFVSRIDLDPAPLVYYKAMTRTKDWKSIFEVIARVYRQYHHCPFMADSTGMAGDVILETLRGEPYNVDVRGYDMAGGRRKDELIFTGQKAIQNRLMTWSYIPVLYDQLVFYDWDDKYLKTDWMMAYCLLARMIEELRGTGGEEWGSPPVMLGAIKKDLDTGEESLVLGTEEQPVWEAPWPFLGLEDRDNGIVIARRTNRDPATELSSDGS